MKFLNNNSVPWKVASKTCAIKAKPLTSLLVDRFITRRFLIDTLEGKEPLGDGVVICIGPAEDVWQQMPSKLFDKYNVVDIDSSGWMLCEPKVGNSVNVFEVTEHNKSDTSIFSTVDDVNVYQTCDFYIHGKWGETTPFGPNVQYGNIGDFICQNRTDSTDIWIVRRKIFLNTYVLKG